MKDSKFIAKRMKLFGIQNLMLEGNLRNLEEKGINIGHSKDFISKQLLEFFEADIKTKAEKMSRLYILYYALENTIRRLISDRLTEKYGPTWWDLKVPPEVKQEVKKKKDEEKDTPMTIRSEDPLTYANFGELIKIFEATWDDFSDTLRSQKAMRQTLYQLSKLRNIIAHSCDLNEDEIKRFELAIKDWFLRVQT